MSARANLIGQRVNSPLTTWEVRGAGRAEQPCISSQNYWVQCAEKIEMSNSETNPDTQEAGAADLRVQWCAALFREHSCSSISDKPPLSDGDLGPFSQSRRVLLHFKELKKKVWFALFASPENGAPWQARGWTSSHNFFFFFWNCHNADNK